MLPTATQGKKQDEMRAAAAAASPTGLGFVLKVRLTGKEEVL